jgi:pimeloyl-ACP methyl ester carboxylesterase
LAEMVVSCASKNVSFLQSYREKMPSAFYREQGQGPGVVCFHSNCSNSSQWRGLMDSLGAGYRVCALDSYGAGKTMPWDSPRNLTLADEAALADAVLDQMGNDTVVVGHSYGGAVALKTAVMRPDKFKAMVLYEPTLFAVLKQVEAEQTNMDAVVEVTDRAKLAVLSADMDTAARVFIDYWSGAGAWDATPAHYKKGILLSIKDIAKWSHALFNEPLLVSDIARITLPTLYLFGSDTTPAAQAVARVMCAALPHVQCVQLSGVGHMGPMTHADLVNTEIKQFVSQLG